jgi:predicted PurR-regulated permease PerM
LVFYTLSLAELLSMLLAPAVQLQERLRVPSLLASAVVVLSVVGLLGVGMSALAAPAKAWIDRTAQSRQKLEPRDHMVFHARPKTSVMAAPSWLVRSAPIEGRTHFVCIRQRGAYVCRR